jgi:hypothetical protein
LFGGEHILSAPGFDNIFVGAGAGESLVSGESNSFVGAFAGNSTTVGVQNSFFGYQSGRINTTGANNTFFGHSSGLANTAGNANTFIGPDTGHNNVTGSNNTLLGGGANVASGNLDHATAIGADSVVSANNTIALGRSNGADSVRVAGRMFVMNFSDFADGGGQLCRIGPGQGGPNVGMIGWCGSSIRFKTNVEDFSSGLDIIRRLRPVYYNWKRSGERDVGFIAEEVAAVEPLLATYDENGQVGGVKYERISTALVNAVKQQQQQIEVQEQEIRQQKKQIELLKQLVCSLQPKGEVCSK